MNWRLCEWVRYVKVAQEVALSPEVVLDRCLVLLSLYFELLDLMSAYSPFESS